MKLDYNVKKEDVKSNNGTRSAEMAKLIRAFVVSGKPIARLDYKDDYRKFSTAIAAVRKAIKDTGEPVRSIQRKENLYIERTDV